MAMNKKAFIAVSIIVALLLSLIGAVTIETSNGNPGVLIVIPKIESPINKTYTVNNIPLILRVEARWSIPWYYPEVYSAFYSLDYQYTDTNITLPLAGKTTLEDGVIYSFNYSSLLPALTNGVHKLKFKAGFSIKEVEFSVNATPPIIRVLSPQEVSYKTNHVALEFSVDKPPTQIRYSLDEQQAIQISGNTTLNDLTEGSHRLWLYVDDAEGSTAASYTVFSVYPETSATPIPTPTLSPSSTPPASPSPRLTLSPSPTESSTLTPSLSPTQSPTLDPSPTPNKREDSFAPLAIVIGLVVAVAAVGLLFALAKHRESE